MTAKVAVLVVAPLVTFAQQSKPVDVVGTVHNISPSEIQVKTGEQPITFKIDKDTELWKGRVYSDTAFLRIGDEVSVHGVRDASGTITARSISAQETTLAVFITGLDRSSSTILATLKRVSARKGPAGSKSVRYYSGTLFAGTARMLAVGQEILVVGLASPKGDVDATRITIYNTDLPVNRALPVPRRR